MPFNGAGTYSPPAASFPAVTATVISSTKYNAVVNDLATALSNCVTKDGQTTVTVPLAFDDVSCVDLTTTGNNILGNAAGDTLTVNATIVSDLLFTDATYDIGKTGATRPRDLFASRNGLFGGTLGAVGNFAVNTNKFTVAAASGNTLAAGTLDVTGNVAVNTNKFTVAAASGNTLVAGTLDATGNFAVNTNKFTVTAASGNTLVAGTFDVTGNVAINTNKFNVTAASGNTTIAGTLDVTGNVTMPTQSSSDSSTKGATTAFVATAIAGVTGAVRKNAIINGSFEVWQRATSFAAFTSGYFADRFRYSGVGTYSHDISRSTDVPTVAQSARLWNYSALVDCQTADVAMAAGDFCAFNQRIEGNVWRNYAQRIFTLSFWVKATKTGIYCVGFINSGGDRSYVAEYTVNVTDTWEQKTITVSASPSAGTWDYTTGLGLQVTFCLCSGTTFQTTANAWNVGNFFATANQVNATDSVSNNFRITGVQLESGSSATAFEERPYAEELRLCQRYFHQYGPEGVVRSITLGQAYLATESTCPYRFPVTMRTTPTLTASSANAVSTLRAAAGAEDTSTAITLSNATPSAGNLNVTSANLVAGDATRLSFVGANDYLRFDAEL